MRMTTRQLKQIIKEEVDRSLNEFDISSATGGMVDPDRVDMMKAMVTLTVRERSQNPRMRVKIFACRRSLRVLTSALSSMSCWRTLISRRRPCQIIRRSESSSKTGWNVLVWSRAGRPTVSLSPRSACFPVRCNFG